MPAPAMTMKGHWALMFRSVIDLAQRKKPTAPSAAPRMIAGRAPCLSRIRPPNCEAIAKPPKKISR